MSYMGEEGVLPKPLLPAASSWAASIAFSRSCESYSAFFLGSLSTS